MIKVDNVAGRERLDLTDLSDSLITGVVDKQLLQYDSGSGQWINVGGSGNTIDLGGADLTTSGNLYADRFRSPLEASAFIDWNAQGHLFMQAAGIELSVFSGEIDMQANVDMNSNDILAALNITATGLGTFDELTLTSPTQDFKLLAGFEAGTIALRGQTSTTGTRLVIVSKDNDGSDIVGFDIIGSGEITHRSSWIWVPGSDRYQIVSNDKELRIRSGTGGFQLELNTDGTLILPAGDVSITNDLIVTGDGTFDELTITNPGSTNYKFTGGTSQALQCILESQTPGTQCWLTLFTKDGDGTDNLQFRLYGKGTKDDVVNSEYFRLIYLSSTGDFEIATNHTGSGTSRPKLSLGTSLGTTQLVLNIDGSVNFGEGNVKITGGVFEVERGADPLVIFDQNTTGAAIINFEGFEEKDGTGTIDTEGTLVSSAATSVAAPAASVWTHSKMIKIQVNGTDHWIPAYTVGMGM